jgi:hypothetical protein
MEMSKGGNQNKVDTGIAGQVQAQMADMGINFNEKERRCQVLKEMIRSGQIDAYAANATLKAWGCKHSTYSK